VAAKRAAAIEEAEASQEAKAAACAVANPVQRRDAAERCAGAKDAAERCAADRAERSVWIADRADSSLTASAEKHGATLDRIGAWIGAWIGETAAATNVLSGAIDAKRSSASSAIVPSIEAVTRSPILADRGSSYAAMAPDGAAACTVVIIGRRGSAGTTERTLASIAAADVT